MYKFGVLGFGKMGTSIIEGVVKAGLYDKKDILIYDLNKDRVVAEGYNAASSELEVYENVESILLSIKPQTFPEVMEKLKAAKNAPKNVITIAAGITIDYMKKSLGDLNIARLMPNLGASINMAVSTLAGSEEAIAVAKPIFESIGTVTVVDEDMINVLLPINGSYPAYFWYFTRSFIRSAVAHGATEEQARKMIADASIGCAEILKSSPKDLDTLINDVCSYKGTTIEGVYVFDEYNLDKIVDECSVKCSNRAKELEK